MYLLKVFVALLLLTTLVQAREIKISVSDLGTTGQMVDTREIINGKEAIYIQKVSFLDKNDPKQIIQPELPSEAFGNNKVLFAEWKDMYNLVKDALSKNIVQGTAVDYIIQNKIRYQRTVKWEGTNKDNFKLIINIDKQ